MKRITIFALLPFLAFASCRHAVPKPIPPEKLDVRIETDGIVVPLADGFVKLQQCGQQIIHVMYAKNPDFFAHQSLIVMPQKSPPLDWSASGPDELTLHTPQFQVRINRINGKVTFLDPIGRVILAEQDRNLAAGGVQQRWKANPDESLYGLGENQQGLTDIKGYDIDLWQHNGTIVIPFLTSSRGYGILWDNPSYTRFGDLRPWVPIPSENLADAHGGPGQLSAAYFADNEFHQPITSQGDKQIDIELRPQVNGIPTSQPATPLSRGRRGQGSVLWQGSIIPPISGEYQFQTFSNGQIKVWLDGKPVIDHWRQGWLPWLEVAKLKLTAGKRALQVEWSGPQNSTVKLLWKTPAAQDATSLWSEVGQGVDYYFVYGPQADKVISGYRKLTGEAPMMPAWAFGLWQSRQRYETAKDSLDVIDGFRSRQIPFDNIVQDWFYWPKNAWGSHEFDPDRFPDPKGWVDAIHQKHAHVMISVWGKFYAGTKNFDAMNAAGFLYPANLAEKKRDWVGFPFTFFDAFNPAARQLFWGQVKPALFDKGVDAWWLDATEPDLLPTPTLEGQKSHMTPTALGPGANVLNAYSIMMGKTFYDNQRNVAPDQRVFILTRSGFASQQRYAEASWSGDTSSNWTAMKKQIAAGIGFCMSGVPYWTMDIGGFSVPPRFASREPKQADVDEWRELATRWFEFGAFCPLLRVHGEFPYREMWQFGGDNSPAYLAQLKFDRLRYRLLPYIYSLAGDITLRGGTMMRGLGMDFPTDATARAVTDQYMFGPAFLVCPVTTYQAQGRSVYLPSGADWYDFWTGNMYKGGRTIGAAAPLDVMPLFVRAGAIVPMGPGVQYVGEKPADPITLLVYTGADADFTLYEDDGNTYDYEKGLRSLIPIRWQDASRTLTIGDRQGTFPTMLAHRTFNIVFISKDQPQAFSFSPQTQRTITYDGNAVVIRR